MVRLSAPEEKAVKAVLIAKNQKVATIISYIFLFFLLFTLIYGILTSVANGFFSVAMVFSDNVFTGLVCFTIFSLSISLFYYNRVISQKTLDDHGHYDVVLEGDCVKVLFPDEPEVIVPINKIDEVVEYDIFYLIHCYGYKDEIVCSKNAFVCGDENDFREFFLSFGKKIENSRNKKVYSSILNHVTKEVRPGFAAFVYSAIACATMYPLFWLLVNVLIYYVPTVLTTVMMALWDVHLVLQIVLGILFIPVGLVAMIMCGVAALTVLAFPILLIFVSYKDALVQIKSNKSVLGYLAISFVIVATIFCLFIILRILAIL